MSPETHAYYYFSCRLCQQIFIPGNFHEVKFILHTKNLNIKQAWLKVHSFDNAENYLQTDSIAINKTKKWETYTLNITNNQANFFYLEISAQGTDNWQERSELWLDRLQIYMNDKNINKTDFSLCRLNSRIFHSSPWSSNFKSQITNKKVVALAETIHGNPTIGNTEFEIVKQMVTAEKCKLLLLELSPDFALLCNLYVQGNQNIQLQEILQKRKYYHFTSDFISKLLNWLKHYNTQASQKICLAGIGNISSNANDHLSHAIQCIFQQKKYHPLANALTKLLTGKEMTKAIHLFRSKFEQSELPDKTTKYLFSMTLQQMAEQEDILKIAYGMFPNKDKTMSKYAIQLIDSLLLPEKQAIIIGHWMHLNKVNVFYPYLEKSCGNYLENKYGENYYVAGILKGKSKHIGRDFDGKFKAFYLETPSNPIFLENYCSDQLKDGDICSLSDQGNLPVWIRISGSIGKWNAGIPIALNARMDSFIWLK